MYFIYYKFIAKYYLLIQYKKKKFKKKRENQRGTKIGGKNVKPDLNIYIPRNALIVG